MKSEILLTLIKEVVKNEAYQIWCSYIKLTKENNTIIKRNDGS